MRMLVSLDGYVARLFAVLALSPIVPLVGCGSVDGPSPFPCEAAEPVKVGEVDTGYEQCGGEWVHRPEAVQCPSSLPRATTCGTGGEGSECTQDSDCTAEPNGYCTDMSFDGVGDVCGCAYGCTQDSDCGAGSICVCGETVGHCALADCTTDADCGEGSLCSTYITEPGCGGTAFACQTDEDECASDADCTSNQQCTLKDGHRVCGEIQCAIGRPFLVAGSARVAGVEARGDWCARGSSPRVAELSAEVRGVLAEEWSRSGQMEHASIAAFARFSMQLLALGAPPELLVDTNRAMGDETEHALACFALASGYAGAPVGPGKLAMEGALDGSDLETVVRLAIVEGCVGETVAAVEAAEAARHAADPAVRRVLSKIAEDEARHAELAWRFVRWALSSAPALAATVESTVAAALAEERGRKVVAASAEDAGWLEHGVVRGAVKAELRRRVVEVVIAPAARVLSAQRPVGVERMAAAAMV